MANGNEGLLIGVATVDITPPVGVMLSGFTPRESTGVGHTLRAEAMIVKSADGSDGWAMITSDVIGYELSFVNDVRAKIATETHLSPDAVLISGTHTHSGPSTVNYTGKGFHEIDDQYDRNLAVKLVDLVSAANAKLQPGRFEVASAECRELITNRRVQAPDGTWTNVWKDPDGRHTGYVDPSIMILAAKTSEGKCLSMLVNFGCHPVVLGHGSFNISGDYVGYLKDALEDMHLTETAMFALAGGANINPRLCLQIEAEKPKAMGDHIAKIIADAAGNLTPINAGKPAAHCQPWNILRSRDSVSRKGRPAYLAGDTMASEIQALRAGDLGIIALPGELFSEYSAWLRKLSPTPNTLVISIANDAVGYLPTAAATAQGAYEVTNAPADDIEQTLMATAKKAFEAIR